MTEPNAAKAQSLAHLLSVVNDESVEGPRRDKAAIALAQLARSAPSVPSSNGAALRDVGAKLPAAGNGAHSDVAPMTLHDCLSVLAGGVGELARRLIAAEQHIAAIEKHKGLAPLAARNAVLEKRIAELEKRPTMAYEGVWTDRKAYNAGSFVTFQGGLWHCEDTNMGVRPGAGSSSWKLAVKRGKG